MSAAYSNDLRALSRMMRELINYDPIFRADCVGKARLSVVVIDADVNQVNKLLPTSNDLRLMPQNEPDRHPLMLFFGDQRRVRLHPLVPLPGCMDYQEMVVVIPDVQWRRYNYPYKGPLAYVPRIYIDNWEALGLGRLCGLDKRIARLESDPRMREFEGWTYSKDELFFRADLRPARRWREPEAVRNYRRARKYLRQPLLGRYRLCSTVDFYAITVMQFYSTLARRMRGRLAFHDQLLQPLFGDTVDLGQQDVPVAAEVRSAFQLDSCWRMRPPVLPHVFHPDCWSEYDVYQCEDPDSRGTWRRQRRPAEPGRAPYSPYRSSRRPAAYVRPHQPRYGFDAPAYGPSYCDPMMAGGKGSFADQASQTIHSLVELPIGVASAVATGLDAFRSQTTPQNLLSLSAQDGLVAGLLNAAPRFFEELSSGVRAAQGSYASPAFYPDHPFGGDVEAWYEMLDQMEYGDGDLENEYQLDPYQQLEPRPDRRRRGGRSRQRPDQQEQGRPAASEQSADRYEVEESIRAGIDEEQSGYLAEAVDADAGADLDVLAAEAQLDEQPDEDQR